jgi:large subunit ribosomal protein L10
MKKKDDKKRDVQDLRDLFGRMPNVFVTGFEKLTVEQDFRLRKTVRDAGGRYKVIKNNLAEKAAKDTPAEDAMQGLRGMTSMAYTDGDPVELAKALTGYAKEHTQFTFKAGVVEGRVFDVGQIEQLTKMPSREELISKLLFLIGAPGNQLAQVVNAVGGKTVRVLNATGSNLTVVLDQACREKKFSS